jgi:hypothetical protein
MGKADKQGFCKKEIDGKCLEEGQSQHSLGKYELNL